MELKPHHPIMKKAHRKIYINDARNIPEGWTKVFTTKQQ